ncbi:MAG TPA: rRNA maturation RNase YbeY [Myxococcales bacterium]|nr:rRNA maturation RNase YbeY [Myxococcales bacterium]
MKSADVLAKTQVSRHAAAVLRKACREWLRGEHLSLALVSDREMRALNLRWRGKDSTTDVLSFPLQERGALGDVVISLPAARRQAREGGWPLSVELRRLLAHGLLHCRGYDHQTAKEAKRMARAEQRLLGARGMVGDSLSQKRVPTARDSR